MLREIEDIKKGISEVIIEMSVKDPRRNTLLDVIEKIDTTMEHFIDDNKQTSEISMAEVYINSEIVRACPHCLSENIAERQCNDTEWTNLDATSNGDDVSISLDFEGNDYFLYFYKCNNCGTMFCIKRLHIQTD
jgi:predicted Zn-ribbon and HTH transcriptional regulator